MREDFATVFVSPKGYRWRQSGHPWVFASDILSIEAQEAGVVSVFGPQEKFLGTALFSPFSKIALRFLTEREEKIDANFWFSRLRRAIDLRRKCSIPSTARRLVFAEADSLPSLIVDQYGDYLSVQILSAGLEKFREAIFDSLMEIISPKGILAKNDAMVRDLEKLPRVVEVVRGEVPKSVVIDEGDLQFMVPLWEGQKTGAFLDQRANRILAGKLASGQAYDIFSYHGWFACHMALRSDKVLCVENSKEAATFILENAKLNHLEKKIEIVQENAFDFLRTESDAKKRIDMINLDPPAFAKNSKEIESAARGYKEINLRAMKLLQPSGILISSSCSQAIDAQIFETILLSASLDSHRDLKIIYKGGQDSDHPILLNFPESHYLKSYFCLVD